MEPIHLIPTACWGFNGFLRLHDPIGGEQGQVPVECTKHSKATLDTKSGAGHSNNAAYIKNT